MCWALSAQRYGHRGEKRKRCGQCPYSVLTGSQALRGPHLGPQVILHNVHSVSRKQHHWLKGVDSVLTRFPLARQALQCRACIVSPAWGPASRAPPLRTCHNFSVSDYIWKGPILEKVAHTCMSQKYQIWPLTIVWAPLYGRSYASPQYVAKLWSLRPHFVTNFGETDPYMHVIKVPILTTHDSWGPPALGS